jgi:AbrB family looped-hinge helix DNA binding protein
MTVSRTSKDEDMALVKVKRWAQITLPADVRRAYDLAEGDYLEVEAVENGILLKPVSVVERKRAWRELHAAAAEVRDVAPKQGQSPEDEEEAIAAAVKEFRKAHA